MACYRAGMNQPYYHHNKYEAKLLSLADRLWSLYG